MVLQNTGKATSVSVICFYQCSGSDDVLEYVVPVKSWRYVSAGYSGQCCSMVMPVV